MESLKALTELKLTASGSLFQILITRLQKEDVCFSVLTSLYLWPLVLENKFSSRMTNTTFLTFEAKFCQNGDLLISTIY